MRFTRFAFMLLAFAALGLAADPFVGTWRLNTAKTKYKTGTPPKEQTVTITAAGSDLDISIAGMAGDGTPISSHYTVPASGGVGKIISSPYEGVTSKRASQTDRSITYLKGGKEVYTTHSKTSADGKSLTVTVKGVNVTGQTVEGTAMYDKQ